MPAFLSPWALLALAAVPLLWWLLRVLPPRPRSVELPAFFLLDGLAVRTSSAARTPWWLLLLRAIGMIAFILAFAEPVLHPVIAVPSGGKPVLMIVDDGWATAAHWPARQDKLREVLSRLRASGRAAIFLPTTAPTPTDAMTAAAAQAWIDAHQPNPWPADGDKTVAAVQKLHDSGAVGDVFYFSDGLAAPDGLLDLVTTVVADDAVNAPYILRATGTMQFSLERLHPEAHDATLELLAYAADGGVVDAMSVVFPAAQDVHEFWWDMAPDMRARVSRIALKEPAMASAVFLAPAGWRQHPVGVIATAETRDFLDDAYYLRRALDGDGQVSLGGLDALVNKKLAALVLPDSTPLTEEEKNKLKDWVAQGGFLIRFAGPNLAAATDDDLVPVTLRRGLRAMEGALTWEKPQTLGVIAQESPFYGLTAPADVTVARQVLAEPSPETFARTWLQLADGTPLITGARQGAGMIALVHTTAGPAWSNFCYSGLYVEALRRMVAQSSGIGDYKAEAAQPPFMLMDAGGRMSAPAHGAVLEALAPGAVFTPSSRTPPGLYGDARAFTAYNLGDSLPRLQALSATTVESYKTAGEKDLRPLLLALALLCLLFETLLTFRLRGVLAALVLLAVATPAQAADEAALASGFHLGYIATGDASLDRASARGLAGLATALNLRTAVRVKGVAAVDPARDPLYMFPILYWPLSERQPPLSDAAARRVQDYLAGGGLIVFDTRDRQFGDSDMPTPGARALRALGRSLRIPALTRVPKDDILGRSFYLLDGFPGLYAGGAVWVEKEPSAAHDGVTSVVIGDADWAAGWAADASLDAHQREMALRAGVNFVMTALTGNYKADQVHVPYLLKRIGR